MKYTLIISDFDGTLSGKDHGISPAVAAAIQKWILSKRAFTIATGKAFLRIKKDVEMLGITTPVITRGGAEIVDSKTGNVIYSKLIDRDTVQDFIEFMAANKYGIIVDTEDKYYSNINYQSGNAFSHHLTLDEFEMREVPKIVISIENKNFEEAEAFLEKVLKNKYPQLHMAKSYFSPTIGKAWDVTSLSATKHLATLELLKILNVAREETVGVGDGYNDFPLLEACGLKVAMQNAPEDLKAIADVIVPSYKEDGIVVLIEKLLKEE